MKKLLLLSLVCASTSCMSIFATKQTYSSTPKSTRSGTPISLQLRPEGTGNGTYSLSAMVLGVAVAKLEGPYRWRFEAQGQPGKQEWLSVNSVRTKIVKTNQNEFFPKADLGKVVRFKPVKNQADVTRARYELPAKLMLKSHQDGPLTIWADVTIGQNGSSKRQTLQFDLKPISKKHRQTVFIPTEIIQSIGTSLEDQPDPMWD